MANQEKEAKKTKRPTALKRDLQSKRRRLGNKIYKSRVRTAIRAFHESLEKNDPVQVTEKLNAAYSILDKCVQKGVFKINKAGRTKSRLVAHTLEKSA